jgi:hypothetical protein
MVGDDGSDNDGDDKNKEANIAKGQSHRGKT